MLNLLAKCEEFMDVIGYEKLEGKVDDIVAIFSRRETPCHHLGTVNFEMLAKAIKKARHKVEKFAVKEKQ